MFNPLGAVSALGSGAMEGVGQGMALQQQYEAMQGGPALMNALQGINGVSALPAGGSGPAPPQQGAMPPPQAPQRPPMPPQAPIQQPPMSGGQAANISPVSMGQAAPPMAGGAGPRGPGYLGVMSPQPMVNPGPNVPATGGFQPPPRPPQPPPRPQAAGTPEQQQLVQSSQGTPHEIEQLRTKGIGWMTPQELATRIELANPNASPGVKFQALKQGMQLLNQSGQMQLMQMMQSREFHEDTLRQQERMEQHRLRSEETRDERLQMQERTQLRNTPYVRGEEKQVTAAKTNLTNTELRMGKIKGHLDALIPIAQKVAITGNMKIDTWLQEAKARLGWTNETYMQYKTMLNNLQSEIAAMSQQTLGSLTVSAREDAKHMAQGVLTPGILKSIGTAVEIEGRVTAQATKDIVNKHQKNIQHYMSTKGEIPEDEEPAAAAPAAPAAPAGNIIKYDAQGNRI